MPLYFYINQCLVTLLEGIGMQYVDGQHDRVTGFYKGIRIEE